MTRGRLFLVVLLLALGAVCFALAPTFWSWISTCCVVNGPYANDTGGGGSILYLDDGWRRYRVKRWGEDAGQKHGPYECLSAEGRIIERGQYRDGVATGVWAFSSGGGYWSGTVVGEKRTGRWQFRLESGLIAAQGEYSDGLRQGVWTYWHEGKIEQQNRYLHGKLEPFSDRRSPPWLGDVADQRSP